MSSIANDQLATPPAVPGSPDGQAPVLVRMNGITKAFGPVTVLRDVSFTIHGGQVTVLAGENGAGKSTLIKILAGVHTEYEGQIEIGGEEVQFSSPMQAVDRGIAVIHQELSLVGAMSVADNLLLGRPITLAGFVRRRQQNHYARELLGQLRLDIDPEVPVETLPIAQQQLVEIAKAIGGLTRRDAAGPRVVIMDEPTSTLTANDAEHLFALIDRLKGQGCGIVYISHKMEEIEQLADRIVVLRDGEVVGEAPVARMPPAELVRLMVGRRIDEQFPPRTTPAHATSQAPALAVEHITVRSATGAPPLVNDVSLQVAPGEIVGLGGLQGSGNSHLLMGIFGAYGRRTRGRVAVDGQEIAPTDPGQAIAAGMALLTNDRKGNGLVLPMSVSANLSLAALPRFSPWGWRRGDLERRAAREAVGTIRLRAASPAMPVAELSGGNQQKVVLAKWLQTNPRVLLLDEPTRGVDVGAKREIYELIYRLTDNGLAILLITSEMPELLALSDRILVMHRGRITAEMNREEATPDRVLEAAMGRHQEPGAIPPVTPDDDAARSNA